MIHYILQLLIQSCQNHCTNILFKLLNCDIFLDGIVDTESGFFLDLDSLEMLSMTMRLTWADFQ